MTSDLINLSKNADFLFLGLAPFLRLNLAGVDLLPIGQQLKVALENHPDNANLWMNLSTLMFCIGQREIGLAMQAQALDISNIYVLNANINPARLKILLLVVAGDLAANTPLDCLLENSDIELIYYFVSDKGANIFPLPLPEHDVLMVGISEADENSALLQLLAKRLIDWPQPIINAPDKIPLIERSKASQILQNIPGLFIPHTYRIGRSSLSKLGNSSITLAELDRDYHFPIILRPVGSHAGRDLARINSANEISTYLSATDADAFFISRFIDYSDKNGLFKKYRIALIAGCAFICHMAISNHWMIHYVNANMYEDAEKRSEEERFMANFNDFAQRHGQALSAIYQRTGLDYVCVDCAETADGRLLIFEIDHAMVIHDMDTDQLFAYKKPHMQKIRHQFREFVLEWVV